MSNQTDPYEWVSWMSNYEHLLQVAREGRHGDYEDGMKFVHEVRALNRLELERMLATAFAAILTQEDYDAEDEEVEVDDE